MPCYRCDLRQVDPDRGESPWKRGVRDGRQVLICPDCQGSFDWMAELDQCPVCGGVHLVRRLGEIECRDCGMVRDPGDAADRPVAGSGAGSGDPVSSGGPAGRAAAGSLAEDVERALERVLGHTRRTSALL
jgi:hypothetical protein